MKVCHYLHGDMGGRGYPEIVTNGEMRGWGTKIAIFAVTSFLNGPLVYTQIFNSIVKGTTM